MNSSEVGLKVQHYSSNIRRHKTSMKNIDTPDNVSIQLIHV